MFCVWDALVGTGEMSPHCLRSPESPGVHTSLVCVQVHMTLCEMAGTRNISGFRSLQSLGHFCGHGKIAWGCGVKLIKLHLYSLYALYVALRQFYTILLMILYMNQNVMV